MVVSSLHDENTSVAIRKAMRAMHMANKRPPPSATAAAHPSLPSSSLEPERQQHTDIELMELVAFLNKCLNYKVLRTIQNKNTLKNAIAEARRSSEYQKEMDNKFYDSITWEQFKNYIKKLNTNQSGGRKRKKSKKYRKKSKKSRKGRFPHKKSRKKRR